MFDDWKDGEYNYCVELCRTRGNNSVPRESVPSYLGIQINSAWRAGRADVHDALEDLLNDWLLNKRRT